MSVSRIALVVLLSVRLWSLDQPVVEVSATPTQVAVGSPVDVTVVYRWPPGWAVSEPDPSDYFRDAFIIDLPPPEIWKTAEEEGRRWRLRCLAHRSGAWELPRPVLSAQGPAGVVQAEAGVVVIQVGSEAAPAQPAPARALWLSTDVPEPATHWWWAAGIAGALAVLAAGLAWWWPRRHEAPAIPAIDVLRQACAAVSLCRDGKEGGAHLSLALRRYCGALFHFDGPATTARECASRLRSHLDDRELVELGRLLDELDGLRWSARDLALAAIEPLGGRALQWGEGVQARLDREAAERSAKAKDAA